ncbi:MAG: folate family ECF transporter S component [Ruthenibacterium sp.]
MQKNSDNKLDTAAGMPSPAAGAAAESSPLSAAVPGGSRRFFDTPRVFVARMRAAAGEVRRTASIAGAGLLCALGLVLNQFTLMVSQLLEIGFSFLAIAVSGFLYGPWMAGLAGVVMDVAGYLLRPNGGFFIGFTLNELLAGVLYGLWLYKKPVSLARTFCACLSVVLLINFVLTPLWLNIMYGNAFLISSARLIKNIIKLPVDTGLLYLVLRLASTHRLKR